MRLSNYHQARKIPTVKIFPRQSAANAIGSVGEINNLGLPMMLRIEGGQTIYCSSNCRSVVSRTVPLGSEIPNVEYIGVTRHSRCARRRRDEAVNQQQHKQVEVHRSDTQGIVLTAGRAHSKAILNFPGSAEPRMIKSTATILDPPARSCY